MHHWKKIPCETHQYKGQCRVCETWPLTGAASHLERGVKGVGEALREANASYRKQPRICVEPICVMSCVR